MVWVAKQYLKDPKTKLFPNFRNAQGVRKIEELIKTTSFTINNLNTYVSINYKHSKINMNVMPLNSFTLVSNKQFGSKSSRFGRHENYCGRKTLHCKGGGTTPRRGCDSKLGQESDGNILRDQAISNGFIIKSKLLKWVMG